MTLRQRFAEWLLKIGFAKKASPMSMVGFPLLLIPFAIYNIIAFLMPSVSFDVTLARLTLVSGAEWSITLSDVLLTLGILLLLLEVMKSARPGGKYLTDHLLSFLVLGATAAEFVMWQKFGTSTFFLLVLMAMVEFFCGISLRGRRAAATASRTTVARREPKVEPKVEPKIERKIEPKDLEPPAEPHVEPDPAPAPAPPPASAAPTPAPAPSAPAVPASASVVPPAASVAESVLMDRPEPVDRPEPKLAPPEPAKPAATAIDDAAPAAAEDTPPPVSESKPSPVVEAEEKHEPAVAPPSPDVSSAEPHPDSAPPASPEPPKH
jgi:hypothetical protein